MKKMTEHVAKFNSTCPVCKRTCYAGSMVLPFHARKANDWCHPECAVSLQKVTIAEREKHTVRSKQLTLNV